MTGSTPKAGGATAEVVDHKLAPRPGRSYCSAVSSHDCLAPAGYRSGMGVAACGGVRRADLHTCAYCHEPVCQSCSTDFKDAGRVCGMHEDDETLEWLGLAWS